MKPKASTTIPLVAVGLLLPMIAARASKNLLARGYEAVTHNPPPLNPAADNVLWKDAIIWSLMAGALGGVTRLFVRRSLSSAPIPAEGDDLEEEVDHLEDELVDA